MVLERRYSKQIIDSQMIKAKFGQRLTVGGSNQAGVGVPFVIVYLEKRAQKMKKHVKNTYCIRTNLLSENLLLHQWCPTACEKIKYLLGSCYALLIRKEKRFL